MQVIRRLTVKTETWRGGDEHSVCGKEGGVGVGEEKMKMIGSMGEEKMKMIGNM